MKKMNWRRLFRMEIGSIALIVVGLILTLNPDFGSAALAAVLGWVLIGGGAVGLLIGILSWPGLGFGEVIGSGVLLLAGIYLLRNPLMLASLVGILLGLLLLTQGIGAVRDALRIKGYDGFWQGGLILGIVMAVVGVVLVFSPMTTSRVVMTVAGIVMIVCGVCNLVSHYRAQKYLKSAGDDSIIDAEE